MLILRLTVFFAMSYLSCTAQTNTLTEYFNKEIIQSLEKLDSDEDVSHEILLEKTKSYQNMAFSSDFDNEIYKVLDSLNSRDFEIIWYYNPLEYKNYVFVIVGTTETEYVCFRYLESVKELQYFGASEINTVAEVAEQLANVNSREIDDSIFFVSFFQAEERRFILSRKFDLLNHFQILVAHLDCQFGN